jgi:flagellar protein FlbT
MPLKITLKPGERLVAGGAVITNGSNHNCELLVNNNAPVLRENDILAEKDATTPCSRIYFTVQLMFIDHENRKIHVGQYWHMVQELLTAAPSMTSFIDQISENIVNEKYYQALRLAGDLIKYEQEVLRHVR